MKNIVFDATKGNIAQAAARLAKGKLVAMPTETVYGLGADATNDEAVARIFVAKGRPQFNPLIVHFADVESAMQAVEFNVKAKKLASIFWPGPLTMILPRKKGADISLLCSAGLPTIAVRIPKHPVAVELIKTLGKPIAAPSANRSGSLSPTTSRHVFESLGKNAGMILAGGKSEVGLESTVVDMTSRTPTLLRPGAITATDLEAHIGKVKVEIEAVDNNPKSPGQLLRHYAPNTPIRLNAVDVKKGEALLGFGTLKFMGIEDGGFAESLPEGQLLNLSASGDLHEAAANLFLMLHKLDEGGFERIAVMDIPNEELGVAINDRLKRAAEG